MLTANTTRDRSERSEHAAEAGSKRNAGKKMKQRSSRRERVP